jgi:hypothetical protein
VLSYPNAPKAILKALKLNELAIPLASCEWAQLLGSAADRYAGDQEMVATIGVATVLAASAAPSHSLLISGSLSGSGWVIADQTG